jgi:hypothetical protein
MTSPIPEDLSTRIDWRPFVITGWMRSFLLPAAAAVVMSATAAMADSKSDCQKGVAMIKAELKKKHPAPVLDALRKALSDAETEVIEADWSECMDYIKTARAALSK